MPRLICITFTLVFAFVDTANTQPNRKPLVAAVNKQIDGEIESLLALYKHIHANAELAFQEEQTAARLAKELRKVGFEVTYSAGIAQWRPGLLTLNDLFGLADAALYEAKRTGRNRVVVSAS